MTDDIEVAIRRIDQLLQLQRWDQAEAEARKALAANPEVSGLHAARAMSLIKLKRVDEALKEAKTAVGLDESDDYAWYALCRALFRAEKHIEARRAAEKAMALNDTDADYPLMRGLARLQLGQTQQAIEDLELALRLDPTHTGAASVLAMVESKMGSRRRAEELARQAAASDPNSAAAHIARSHALWSQGRRREAVQAAKEAMRLDPQSGWAQDQLKEVLQANSPAYRLAFRSAETLGQYSHGSRWSIGIVAVVASRCLRVIARMNPDILWFIVPLVALYVLFWVLQWEVKPLSCFFLLLHPLGRPLLTTREKLAAAGLGGGFPLGAALVTLGFSLPASPLIVPGVILALASLITPPLLAR
ncbi:MAG: tetratricopeptide repeat protein [Planctomycetes bacterium]|nr:tetratricopeptide repeat protein [Planctomycetota bacterium]